MRHFLKMQSLVNVLLEDGLYRSKHVECLSQNKKKLLVVTCAICWVKYFIIRTGIPAKVCSAVKLFTSVFEGPGSRWLVLVYYEAATGTSRALLEIM